LNDNAILKQGKSYMKNSNRFARSAVGGILASWASSVLADNVKALNFAATNSHFINGVKALAQGNLVEADRQFRGKETELALGGFYLDLNTAGLQIQAGQFLIAWEKAYAKALKDEINIEKRIREACPNLYK
jgi:hypothetical protein